MYWLQDSDECYSLARGGNTVGVASFNNGDFRWYAYNYSKVTNDPWGCQRIGPFDTSEEAQIALEGAVTS